MTGIYLFAGFFAGLVFTLLTVALLPKLPRFQDGRQEEKTEPEPRGIRENKELLRLRRQLAEIERYNGGVLRDADSDE